MKNEIYRRIIAKYAAMTQEEVNAAFEQAKNNEFTKAFRELKEMYKALMPEPYASDYSLVKQNTKMTGQMQWGDHAYLGNTDSLIKAANDDLFRMAA